MKNMKRKRPLSIFEFEQQLKPTTLNHIDQQMVIGGRGDALPPSQFQDMSGIKGPKKGGKKSFAFELDSTVTMLGRVEVIESLDELQNPGRGNKKNED